MNISITGSPHLRKTSINHSGATVRSHFRLGILIHTIDGNACSPLHLRHDIHAATNAHGIDFTLGICRNIDGRMIGLLACVDVRVVHGSEAVLVDIRDSCPTLKIEEIFAPAHTKTCPHGDNAGLFQFVIAILPAVRCGYFNPAGLGGGNIGMVDFCPESLLVAAGTNSRIGHGTTHAHFLAANGHTARHGGLFRQFRSRDGKFLHVVQFGIFACGLAINDAFRIADAAVNGHGSHCAQNLLIDIHIYAAGHSQSLALIRGCQFDGIIRSGKCDIIVRQISSGSIVEGIVGQ